MKMKMNFCEFVSCMETLISAFKLCPCNPPFCRYGGSYFQVFQKMVNFKNSYLSNGLTDFVEPQLILKVFIWAFKEKYEKKFWASPLSELAGPVTKIEIRANGTSTTYRFSIFFRRLIMIPKRGQKIFLAGKVVFAVRFLNDPQKGILRHFLKKTKHKIINLGQSDFNDLYVLYFFSIAHYVP